MEQFPSLHGNFSYEENVPYKNEIPLLLLYMGI
jgi:hypothetical protein